MPIEHHPLCNADYPEKPIGEKPQEVTRQALDDGFYVDTCSDCGAFETNLPPESDPYWDDVREETNKVLTVEQAREKNTRQPLEEI